MIRHLSASICPLLLLLAIMILIIPSLVSLPSINQQVGAATLIMTQQEGLPKRPQTPKPPFPYKQREAAYTNSADGARLAGLLTIPEGAGPHPAVILIPGSGGADRDGTAAGHRPFLVIADHLTRRGVAVLRVDSRKAASYLEVTCEDTASDVLAGITFLQKQPEIDARRIGLIGHSLGGMIAPMIAAKSKDVAFIILLASPCIPVRNLTGMQIGVRLRSKGMIEDEVRQRTETSLALLDRLSAGEESPALREALREFIKMQLPSEMVATPEQIEGFTKQEIATRRSRYYKFLHTYDPRATMRQVRCPVLALNGSLDQAVSARENLSEIEKALRDSGNSEATIIELYGLNHFFQTAKTGSPLEIGQIEETLSPKVLQVMTAWIRLHVGFDR